MASEVERRGIELEGRGLREHTARGALVNAAFSVGLAGVSLAQRFLVAIFLTASEYGLWGLIFVAVTAVLWLKDVGISDKFVQQAERGQEAAFQKAFTLNLLWTGLFCLLVLATVPLFALIYGQPEIVAPGLVLTLAVAGGAFHAPAWIYYRRMRFVRQRALLAIDPVVALAVTLSLAAAGSGYWSLVIGVVAGSWAAAVASVLASPYPLRLRFERTALREYFSFSWPLLVASGSGMITIQASVIVGEEVVGLAGIGAIGLTGTIVAFADRVDRIVTQTIYPAVCAVRDRLDLLFESFTKSNRLALLWGMPFGFGLALFAPDLVRYVLGEKWNIAIGLLQVFGVVAAFRQIAFNWTVYHRALDDTRPLAVNGALAAVAFLALGVPGLIVWGLPGYAAAIIAVELIQLVVRTYYLERLFEGFSVWRHSARALAPTLPPIGLVLLMRLVESGDRSLPLALAELAVYVAATVACSWLLERELLRELVAYLRRGTPRPAGVA